MLGSCPVQFVHVASSLSHMHHITTVDRGQLRLSLHCVGWVCCAKSHVLCGDVEVEELRPPLKEARERRDTVGRTADRLAQPAQSV